MTRVESQRHRQKKLLIIFAIANSSLREIIMVQGYKVK